MAKTKKKPKKDKKRKKKLGILQELQPLVVRNMIGLRAALNDAKPDQTIYVADEGLATVGERWAQTRHRPDLKFEVKNT